MILTITTPDGTQQYACTMTLTAEGVDHLDPAWTVQLTGNTQCQMGNTASTVYVDNAILIPLQSS